MRKLFAIYLMHVFEIMIIAHLTKSNNSKFLINPSGRRSQKSNDHLSTNMGLRKGSFGGTKRFDYTLLSNVADISEVRNPAFSNFYKGNKLRSSEGCAKSTLPNRIMASKFMLM